MESIKWQVSNGKYQMESIKWKVSNGKDMCHHVEAGWGADWLWRAKLRPKRLGGQAERGVLP
jgi:hypothetical protein